MSILRTLFGSPAPKRALASDGDYDPEWLLPKEQQWARDPKVLKYWAWMREAKPGVTPPDWYVRYVLNAAEHPIVVPPAPPATIKSASDKQVRDSRSALGVPEAHLPHRLPTTRVMTTPVPNIRLASRTGIRHMDGPDGRSGDVWQPSQLQLLDLLDLLTRPGFAARRWPQVKGAGRWARRWGHSVLGSEPKGDETLRELGRTGILHMTAQGSARRYLIEERDRAGALYRFGQHFGFTVARDD